MKLPDEPDVFELLKSPDGFGYTVLWLEDDTGLVVDKSGLTGYAELLLEGGLDMSDDIHKSFKF